MFIYYCVHVHDHGVCAKGNKKTWNTLQSDPFTASRISYLYVCMYVCMYGWMDVRTQYVCMYFLPRKVWDDKPQPFMLFVMKNEMGQDVIVGEKGVLG